jgi:DNA polymerase-3 subunit beta
LGDFEGDVVITNDEQQVLFEVGDVELVARLIEGNYPDYRRLIPSEFTSKAILKKTDFTNITKISSLFARETAGSVTINFDDKGQQVNIKSIASQIGENTAGAEAKVTGSGSVTLNSRYIIDALHVLTGEEVEFAFNGKLEPTLLRDPKSPDYVHIIMPLKS